LISTFGDLPWKVVPQVPTEAVIENNQWNIQWPQDYCTPFFEVSDMSHSGTGFFKNTTEKQSPIRTLEIRHKQYVPFPSKSRQDLLLFTSLNKLMNDSMPISLTFF
jgi:hypothetical protein